MQRAYCKFRKEVNFKNGYIVETSYPIQDFPFVKITDISKDYQEPLVIKDHHGNIIRETVDIGNPKLKRMSKEEFERVFEITHIK